MGATIDIVYGVWTGSVDPIAQVYPLTYAQNATWYDPYSKQTMCVPDETLLIDLDETLIEQTKTVLVSTDEVMDAETSSMGLGIGFASPDLNVSATFQHERDYINIVDSGSTLYVAQFIRHSQLWSARLNYAALNASPFLLSALEGLPLCDITTTLCLAQHCQVIQQWGTHLMAGVVAGASLNVSIAYSSSFVNTYGMDWTSTQAGLSIDYEGWSGGFNMGKNVTKGQISSQFAAGYTSYVGVVGGDADIYTNEGYNQWVLSVPSHPALLMLANGPNLIPLYQLIPETSMDNLTRRKNLRQVLIDYIESGGMSCPT